MDHVQVGVLKGQFPGCARRQVACDDIPDPVNESTRSEDEPFLGAEPCGVGVCASSKELEPPDFSARLLPGAPPG